MFRFKNYTQELKDYTRIKSFCELFSALQMLFMRSNLSRLHQLALPIASCLFTLSIAIWNTGADAKEAP